MTDLPAPLTPPECDLRGLHYMPLFGDRLFASATWIAAKPEAKVAALRLWWHAYAKEVPAASLPDDDTLLADYAGYGVAVSAWRKVRAAAMRGWVKCADNRWYHHVVAELALEAWEGRKRNREKQRQWREKNRPRDGDVTVTSPVSETVTQPLCNAGEGEGEGEKEKEGDSPPAAAALDPARAAAAAAAVVEAVNHPNLDPSKSHGLVLKAGVVQRWIDAGADLEFVIVPTVRRLCEHARRPIGSWGYFTDAVREAQAATLAAAQPLPPITPEHVNGRTHNGHAYPDRTRPERGGMVRAALRNQAERERRGQAAGDLAEGQPGLPASPAARLAPPGAGK